MIPRIAHPLEALESLDGYRQHFMDARLWHPFVERVCRRHNLTCESIRPGLAGTFPAFIVDKRWVVKFFGSFFGGEQCWQVETEVADLMAGLPEIPVAKVVASGTLETVPGWHYLIFDFIQGVSIGEVYGRVKFEDKLALVRWLGAALRRMHRLQTREDTVLPRLSEALMRGWFAVRWPEGREKWPEHLAIQVEGYLRENVAFIQSGAEYFIHADLTCDHILGHLSDDGWKTLAVIDFGDAMLGNIFYELAALHLDLFDCDKRLLAVFLKAYGLSPDRDFVRKAMVTSLLHQFDVFGPLFEWKPQLREVCTLEEFADLLWNFDLSKGYD
jgi:hypothetical protein